MAYGTDLGITLPTVGVTLGPAWASSLNSALTDIISVLETKVTVAGLDINADLSFRSAGTSFRAKDVKGVSFTNQDSTLAAGTYPVTLFTSDADGELYFNDNAGRQVQVTSDGAVNVSTAGGVTGAGYGSSSVEINWDAGSSTYKLRSGPNTDDYASVALNDVKLNDGSGNFVTLTVPSLASDYTLTLPTESPASTSVVVMASSGALSTTRAVAIDTLTATSTVAATGLITATAGVTAGANTHVTVSGTGLFKHGTVTLAVAGCAFQGELSHAVVGVTGQVVSSLNSEALRAPLPSIPHGARIVGLRFLAKHRADSSIRTYRLRRTNISTDITSTVVSGTDTSTSAYVSISLSGLPHTLDSNSLGYLYFLEVLTSSTGAGDAVRGALVDYDQT